MNALSILPLADRPDAAAPLARWHHAEWGALYGGRWTLAAALHELLEHAAQRQYPTSWVAEYDGALAGSVSLIGHDADELEAFAAPWLASLWVLPAYRRRGIGAALVRHVQAYAGTGGWPQLHLFTAGEIGFYQALDWQPIARAQIGTTAVTVMRWSQPVPEPE